MYGGQSGPVVQRRALEAGWRVEQKERVIVQLLFAEVECVRLLRFGRDNRLGTGEIRKMRKFENRPRRSQSSERCATGGWPTSRTYVLKIEIIQIGQLIVVFHSS